MRVLMFCVGSWGVFVQCTSACAERVREVEAALLDMTIPVPVYFSRLDTALATMYDALQADLVGSQLHAGDKFHISAPAGSGKPIPEVTFDNLQGWLPGTGFEEGNDLDTIAVVAAYDSFSAAPVRCVCMCVFLLFVLLAPSTRVADECVVTVVVPHNAVATLWCRWQWFWNRHAVGACSHVLAVV